MGAYSDAILATSGISSYWRMDDTGSTMTDAVGGKNGTINAGVIKSVASLLTVEPTNTCMGFDGSTNSLCSAITTPGNGFTALTWECWCRPNTVPADGTFKTILMGDTAGFNYLQMDGDGFEVNVKTNLTSRTITDAATNVFNVGTIVHVAFVWTTSDTSLRVYKNGVQVGVSTTVTGATCTNTGNGAVGATAAATDVFDGRIDEVALYNSSLSAATLLSHYNLGISTGVRPAFNPHKPPQAQ